MNRRTLLGFLVSVPALLFGRTAKAERVEKVIEEDRPKLTTMSIWVPNADPDQVIWRLKDAVYKYSWEPVALEDYVDTSSMHFMEFNFQKRDGSKWGDSHAHLFTQTVFDNMDFMDVAIRGILELFIKHGAKSAELHDIKVSFFHL